MKEDSFFLRKSAAFFRRSIDTSLFNNKESSSLEHPYYFEKVDQLSIGDSNKDLSIVTEGESYGPGSIIAIDNSTYAIADTYKNSILVKNIDYNEFIRVNLLEFERIVAIAYDNERKELLCLVHSEQEQQIRLSIKHFAISTLQEVDSYDLLNPPTELFHYAGSLKMKISRGALLLNLYNHFYAISGNGTLQLLPGHPVDKNKYLKVEHQFPESTILIVDEEGKTLDKFTSEFPFESLKSFELFGNNIYLEYDHFIPAEENNGKALQVAAVEVIDLNGQIISEYLNQRENRFLIDRDIFIQENGSIWHLQAPENGFEVLRAQVSH